MHLAATFALFAIGYLGGLVVSACFAWQMPEKLLLAHKGVTHGSLALTLAASVILSLPTALFGYLSLRCQSNMQWLNAMPARSGLRTGIVLGLPVIAFAVSFAASSCSPYWQTEKLVSAALRQSANAGDADAQNKLGWRYSNGVGAIRSREEAIYWWEKSAAQGFAKAQHNLGLAYGNGRGVKADKRDAAKWLDLASEQGYDPSQLVLAKMYYSGIGVDQSYSKAIELFTKAGRQGNAEALFALGGMHKAGQGVAVSLAEARSHYLKAAALNYDPAQLALRSLDASAPDGLRTSVSVD